MLQQLDVRPDAGSREVSHAPAPILREGETCWRIARADRFALIVDAADYFAHAKAAMLKARHSIMLIGWDFDLRIRLTPDAEMPDGRMRLGDFLKYLVQRKPGLRIHILQWDMAVLFTLRWQIVPMLLHDLASARRIQLRFDSTHPQLGAHHQKIVVIDDSVAFCGGIDMTDKRWDTREHLKDDPHRIDPSGTPYGPWHDTTTAVDGDAARALGELARARWRDATGKRLPVPKPHDGAWPDALAPQVRNVDVGIARTLPRYGKRKEVHEIEELSLAAVRAARHTIYIENQFFASQRIAEAIMDRLEEPDGPEVLVVNPDSAESWLEQATMDAARAVILQRVRAADRYGRFRIYCPVNAAGEAIYVHSKVLAIDDRLLRVGSSNIDNRSMGLDSECDLVIEGTDEKTRAAILQMRDDLIAEHLDVSPEAVAQEPERRESLIAAVEALRKDDGRSLRPLPRRDVTAAEEAIVAMRLADPERPNQPQRRLEHAAKRVILRHPYATLAAGGLLIAGLAYAGTRLYRR